MSKTQGPTLMGGMRDSLIVQFSVPGGGVSNADLRSFGNSTTATVFNVGFESKDAAHVSGQNQQAFTLPGSYTLARVTCHGRNNETSLLSTTPIFGNASDSGLNIRVLRAPAATPRTFGQIVDNSIDGSTVVNYIHCPSSATTQNQPFNILYSGRPQTGQGTVGAGWTGPNVNSVLTSNDFVIGDRIQITGQQSGEPTTAVSDMVMVYAHFTATS